MIKRDIFEYSLDHPLEYWGEKSKSEVQSLLGKQVAGMVGFSQNNPHHCYDLFGHTLHTLQSLPKETRMQIKVAAFFHDVGKPDVVKEKEGRYIFYGHSIRSAKIAPPLLRKLGYSENEIKEIGFYVEHHDDFIQWQLPEEVEDKEMNSFPLIKSETVKGYCRNMEKKLKDQGFILPTKQLILNLLSLCSADIAAQAEKVYMNGKLCDSKEHKQTKIERIKTLLILEDK